MLLHWYACISINTYHYEIYYISLETVWWALSNASFIVQICPAVHEILANRDFIVTDDLISQMFVVAFVHPIYVQIAFIWGFPAQLSLWKSVHWLLRYKLNEVCNNKADILLLYYVMLFVPGPSMTFFISSDYVTMIIKCVTTLWQISYISSHYTFV